MKSAFYASLLVALMLAVIVMNAVYIHNTADKFLNLTYALPTDEDSADFADPIKAEGVKAKINELLYLWEKNEALASVSIQYRDIEKIRNSMDSVREYFFCGEYGQYLDARKRLLTSLERLKQNELPNFENILKVFPGI